MRVSKGIASVVLTLVISILAFLGNRIVKVHQDYVDTKNTKLEILKDECFDKNKNPRGINECKPLNDYILKVKPTNEMEQKFN